VADLDVGRRHHARPFLRQAHHGLVAAGQAHGDALEVQQQLDDVFLHALKRGEFVHRAVDLHFGNGRPR
jgi:hypothetical protein